jgi:hypothetical protein
MTWSRIRAFLTRRRTRGQSLVEFTILLPVLLIMISGLIELGFLLNYYLDVIDAAREAARWGASDDPFTDLSGAYVGDLPTNPFYTRVAGVAQQSIDMGSGGQISLDPAVDDIVVSVFSVNGGTVEFRYPAANGDFGWCSYCNHTSMFRDFAVAPPLKNINDLLDPAAPNAGVVVVEIWYSYHMILGLPWITAFMPNPVPLYAYSVMPNAVAEPTPTAPP